MRALRSGASTASTDGVRRGTRLKKGTPPYSPSAEYRRVRGVHAGRNRPQSTRWYSSERVRRVPYGTPHGLQTEYRRAVTHGVLPRYSAVLPMRRRAREYDEYRTVLRGSGTRGGLRGSDPKKGIFEYDEYRTVLRRDGRYIARFRVRRVPYGTRREGPKSEYKRLFTSTALPGQTPILDRVPLLLGDGRTSRARIRARRNQPPVDLLMDFALSSSSPSLFE